MVKFKVYRVASLFRGCAANQRPEGFLAFLWNVLPTSVISVLDCCMLPTSVTDQFGANAARV